jgi:hypothetical protein
MFSSRKKGIRTALRMKVENGTRRTQMDAENADKNKGNGEWKTGYSFLRNQEERMLFGARIMGTLFIPIPAVRRSGMVQWQI